MATGVVDEMLKSVDVRNMITDSDESENSEEDIKFDVDWIHRVVSNSHKRSANLDASLQPKKNVNVVGNVVENSPTRYRCFTGTFTIPLAENWVPKM